MATANTESAITLDNCKYIAEGTRAVLYWHRYHQHGNPGLQLRSEDGEPLLTASVNPDHKLPDGCIAIKTWSENEGVAQDLRDAGIIGSLVDQLPSGYVVINVYELLAGPYVAATWVPGPYGHGYWLEGDRLMAAPLNADGTLDTEGAMDTAEFDQPLTPAEVDSIHAALNARVPA